MYKIYHTFEFDKQLEKKLTKEERKEVENFEKKQLQELPFVGDPLSFPFLREKKVGGKRIYYLIYEKLGVVLMTAISDKKSQQTTIDAIKNHLKEYHLMVESALREHDESDRPSHLQD